MTKRTTDRNGEIKETQSLVMRVETTYRFVNVDNPEEYIEVIAYGDGVDTQDKAPGKAMTYADKYALLKAYKIITGDDPDQQASEPGQFNAPPKSSAATQKAVCAECGKSITLAERDYSIRKFKRSLCRDCQKLETF